MTLYLYRNGQQEGPYELHAIRDQLRAGVLSMQDPAWWEGCEDWKTVGAIPELIPASPPPLPAAPVQVQIIREIEKPAVPEKKKINKRGAWCPHCGNRNSYRATEGSGCLLLGILFITIVGIIFIPFLPKSWHCRSCGHTWK
jgi:hypothetical protein